MRRLWLVVPLMALALLLPAPVDAQEVNLLQNASFEDEQNNLVSADPQAGEISFAVPNHWGGGFAPPGPESWRNVHPAGFPHFAGFRIDGPRSYHVSRGGGTFTAWIFQQVSVAPDTPVRGGAYAFLEGNTGIYRVGIDPTGGTNPFEPRVVWSAWSGDHYQWSSRSVETVAQGGTVTLFLFATQDQPDNPNGIYWDAAFLNGIPGDGPIVDAAAAAATTNALEARVRLNVRSGPGTQFDRVGLIGPGTPYPILGEESGWFLIDVNGQRGYVSGEFVNVLGEIPIGPATVTPPPGEVVAQYTVRANLRLRTGPGAQFEQIGTVEWGDTAGIVGRSANNNWLQVSYQGLVGWVTNFYGVIEGDLSAAPVTN